jgi:hypothetical protein
VRLGPQRRAAARRVVEGKDHGDVPIDRAAGRVGQLALVGRQQSLESLEIETIPGFNSIDKVESINPNQIVQINWIRLKPGG